MQSRRTARPVTKPKVAVSPAAARKWLQARGVKACPVCTREDLRVSKDFYVALGTHGPDGAPDLGRGSRLVRVRCGNCAHVMFFHARQMGQE